MEACFAGVSEICENMLDDGDAFDISLITDVLFSAEPYAILSEEELARIHEIMADWDLDDSR